MLHLKSGDHDVQTFGATAPLYYLMVSRLCLTDSSGSLLAYFWALCPIFTLSRVLIYQLIWYRLTVLFPKHVQQNSRKVISIRGYAVLKKFQELNQELCPRSRRYFKPKLISLCWVTTQPYHLTEIPQILWNQDRRIKKRIWCNMYKCTENFCGSVKILRLV